MLTTRRCARCGGFLLDTQDVYGPHQTCLQCGHDESPHAGAGLGELFDQIVRSRVGRPTSQRQRRRR